VLCRPQAEEPEPDLEPDSPPARRHFPITSFTNHLSVFGGLRRTSWRRCSRPQTLGQQSCLVQVPQEGVPDARPSPCASALATSGNVVVICHHQVLRVFACSNAPQHRATGQSVRRAAHACRASRQPSPGRGRGLTKYALASRRASRPECVGTAKPLICATEFGPNLSLHLCPRNRAAWR
jgi:hypothetical protein